MTGEATKTEVAAPRGLGLIETPTTWRQVFVLAGFVLALRISRRPFPRWLIRAVAGRENDRHRRASPGKEVCR